MFLPVRQAFRLTQQVDSNGMAAVVTSPLASARTAHEFLRTRGLMASICDTAHIEMESRGLALLKWLASLCSQTDGLRRVVAQELVAAPRPPPPSADASSPLKETPPGGGMDAAAAAADGLNGKGGGETRGGGGGGAGGGGGGAGAGGGGEGGADATATRDASVASWDSCSWLTRHSELFGLSTKRGYLWVRQTRGTASSGRGVLYEATRDAPLGVLVAADPLLARPLRLALHGLLMRLLVDQELKRDFALAFARLYEFLNALYCRGIGVSDESIFGFSVQTFTTPSLVRLLANASAETPSALLPNPDGGVPKVWRFSETPGLLALLAKALVRTLLQAGCRGCGYKNCRQAVVARQAGGGVAAEAAANPVDDENAFLEHDITARRRYGHVFRDLEYALQSPGTALDVATLTANPGPGSDPLRLWLKVLLDLQYMDVNVRRVGSHVEYESRRFYRAFDLSSSLATVHDALIDRALRKPPPTAATAT
ncbi:unnamed protein product, partial [Laminaria digitata]